MLSTLRDGIDNVVIQFDAPEPVFQAGKPITGKILVVCEETTAVRSIRLALNGTMNIFWHDPVDRVDHAEFEDYLEEEIVVWEPKRGDKDWMYPGQHEYPFEYTLSEKLPETMEESYFGKICYECKASVYMTQGRVCPSLDNDFYVVAAPLSEGKEIEEGIPTEEELPKENYAYGTIGGTCFQRISYVELFLKLKKNRFQIGESIDVTVQARVEGGKSDIDKITAILVQETIFSDKIDTPEDSSSVKEMLVFQEATDTEDTDAGETKTYNLKLPIDKRMAPTAYPNCDFIQMEYYVHAVARTHSFYDDIVVKLPIVIVGDKGPVENEEAEAPPEDEEGDDNAEVLLDMDDEEDEDKDEREGDEGSADDDENRDEKGDEADEDGGDKDKGSDDDEEEEESLGGILGDGDSD